jgi:hypothetical protein
MDRRVDPIPVAADIAPLAPISPGDLYHVGMVVANLADEVARLSAIGHYRWTTLVGRARRIRHADREMAVHPKIVISLDAPHIELVEALPGTVWDRTAVGALHHIGYFTDDLAAAQASLEANGFTMEVCGLDDTGQVDSFAYFTDSNGVRIEVVHRRLFGDWTGFLAEHAAQPDTHV